MTEVARHWIDGSWLESALVAYSYNPATGELRGSFADGGDGEARAAVEAARAAFEVTDWGHDRRLRLTGTAGTGRVVRSTRAGPGFDVDSREWQNSGTSDRGGRGAGVTTFAGHQNCMAGSRILVQRGIADQVREHLAEQLTRVVVGSGEEATPKWDP